MDITRQLDTKPLGLELGWWESANTLHVFHRFTSDGGDVASRFPSDLLWVL